MELQCPICAASLQKKERTYGCDNGHCFDVARQGYIHLLPVQQKHSAQPGDTKEQVLARRAFLDGGFYAPIVQALCALAQKYNCTGPILDAGCGEGYYSSRLADALESYIHFLFDRYGIESKTFDPLIENIKGFVCIIIQ